MTRASGTRIPFTDAMRTKVIKLRQSTGWGAISVSKRIIANKMPGHDHATIGRVLGIVNGQARNTVSKELYESVIYVLENLDRQEAGLVSYEKSPDRIVVDIDFLAKLEALMKQYHHLSIPKTLRLLGAPADLKPIIVSRVLHKKQTTLKANHYAFFQKCFADKS